MKVGKLRSGMLNAAGRRATLSAILDTRNESAANDSSFPPPSAFVPPLYSLVN